MRERGDHDDADLISEALVTHNGDVQEAQKGLSIPRKTFYDKLRRRNIDINQFRRRPTA